MSSFVGESEENLREIFSKAKKNSPCAIIIDEIDVLTGIFFLNLTKITSGMPLVRTIDSTAAHLGLTSRCISNSLA